MNNTFIGIDISKETLDFYVKNSESESHYQIDNEVKSIKNSSKNLITVLKLLLPWRIQDVIIFCYTKF